MLHMIGQVPRPSFCPSFWLLLLLLLLVLLALLLRQLHRMPGWRPTRPRLLPSSPALSAAAQCDPRTSPVRPGPVGQRGVERRGVFHLPWHQG